MPFNPEDLLNTPYDELGDVFAEHGDELNKLPRPEQIALVIQMLLACPSEQLQALNHATRALPKSQDKHTSFGYAFSQAYALNKEIDRHLLSREPWNFFISCEFQADVYQELAGMFQRIEGKEDEILSRLENTPEGRRPQVLGKMQKLFSQTDLLIKTEALFAKPLAQKAPTSSVLAPTAAQAESAAPEEAEVEKLRSSCP